MHVVITLAGHSRRFYRAGYKNPKFLIRITQKTILEHVLDMFNDDDHFHFVINTNQEKEEPNLVQWLKGLRKSVFITIIAPHDKGPVYSISFIRSVPDKEPVLISYCDFLVRWDYTRFKRQVVGYDMAIPAFRGFHPASFGNTLYAYMRVDRECNLIELQEKKNFTSDRINEYASSGLYYFKSWEFFERYSTKLLGGNKLDHQGLDESYVSLLANLIVRDGHIVKVTQIDKFICLGTPEDLEQFIFWKNYFFRETNSNKKINFKTTKARKINLIPMAGLGSRFRGEKYNISKPLIMVGKEPMAVKSAKSFPECDLWIFLSREEDFKKYSLDLKFKNFFEESLLHIPVVGKTSGQAATCLLAKEMINDDDELLIASCDYETVYDHEKWNNLKLDKSIDAVIWTYRLRSALIKDPNAFGYCETVHDSTKVKNIVEKKVISNNPGNDPMIVGTFWFRRGGDFISCAEEAIKSNLNVNGEHYIANAMNLLIKKNKDVRIFDIEQWVSFGNPFELDTYYYWDDYFYSAQISDT